MAVGEFYRCRYVEKIVMSDKCSTETALLIMIRLVQISWELRNNETRIISLTETKQYTPFTFSYDRHNRVGPKACDTRIRYKFLEEKKDV